MTNEEAVKVLNNLENRALKVATYGANLARPLAEKIAFDAGNYHVNGFDAGSPIVPIYFTGLEILGSLIPEIKGSSLYRSSKLSGAIGYGVSAGVHFCKFLDGDSNCGVKSILDAGMFYQLCKDSMKEYLGTEKNFFKDTYHVGKNVKNSVSKFFKGLKK